MRTVLTVLLLVLVQLRTSTATGEEQDQAPLEEVSVSGVVRDTVGHPIPWAFVTYRPEGDQAHWTTTDQEGRFQLERVPGGTEAGQIVASLRCYRLRESA